MGLASDPPPGCLEVAVVEIHVSTWKTPESFCRHLPRSAEVGASLAGGAMPGQQEGGGRTKWFVGQGSQPGGHGQSISPLCRRGHPGKEPSAEERAGKGMEGW